MATKGKQFKAGDVVVLKSGGFPMTVMSTTNHEGEVDCAWFFFDGYRTSTLCADSLDITTLRLDANKNTIE